MGALVLVEEEFIRSCPESIFELFASGEPCGWLFGATCTAPAPGAVVRFDVPMGPGVGGLLEGTGRIRELVAPGRIVVEHETPWRGRVTCTIEPSGEGSRVRLTAQIPEDALRWLLRRRGAILAAEAGPDEIPVGLLLSRSGSGSFFAGASENLAQLAVAEVNEAATRASRRVRLVVGDDGTSPAMGAAEARRLVEDEGCRVVITNVTSATFEAVCPVVIGAGALVVFCIPNEGGVTGERLFRLGERPSGQLRGAVPRLMDLTGGRRWYLAGNDYCWPWATNRAARPIIERAGGVVAGAALAPLGTRDFAPILEDIERSGAELILSTFVGADEAAFERQFHAAGLRSRCRTLAPALDEYTREHIGDQAGAGIWSVYGYFAQLPSVANRAFLDRYHAQFGACSPPPSSFSESVYETVHFVADAARRAGSWEPSEVGRRLGDATFDGPRGRVKINGPDRLEQHLYLAESVPGGFAVRDRMV